MSYSFFTFLLPSTGLGYNRTVVCVLWCGVLSAGQNIALFRVWYHCILINYLFVMTGCCVYCVCLCDLRGQQCLCSAGPRSLYARIAVLMGKNGGLKRISRWFHVCTCHSIRFEYLPWNGRSSTLRIWMKIGRRRYLINKHAQIGASRSKCLFAVHNRTFCYRTDAWRARTNERRNEHMSCRHTPSLRHKNGVKIVQIFRFVLNLTKNTVSHIKCY